MNQTDRSPGFAAVVPDGAEPAAVCSASQFGTAGFGALKRSALQVAALDRIREWTRERFALPQDAAILVAEVACGLPGCPPLETAVAFWTAGDTRHQFKIFKPAHQVTKDDLPFAWLKEALAVTDGFGCACC
jgi:hypothetical protein